MSYENVQLVIEDNVAVITLNRPKALNALNTQTVHELGSAVMEVLRNQAVRALILTGAGEKAFVAGADIAEMSALTPGQAREFASLGHMVLQSLENLAIPTIAAVNGFALGGGLELALACDLVYASENAVLGLPEVGLGVIPGFGGTQRLSRIVGKQRAKELVFTGRRITAEVALRQGLILDVVPQAGLLAHCRAVAQEMAKNGPLAIAQAKRAIEFGMNTDLQTGNELERQAFGVLFGTEDQREGMSAFLEKRKPSFQGR